MSKEGLTVMMQNINADFQQLQFPLKEGKKKNHKKPNLLKKQIVVISFPRP